MGEGGGNGGKKQKWKHDLVILERTMLHITEKLFQWAGKRKKISKSEWEADREKWEKKRKWKNALMSSGKKARNWIEGLMGWVLKRKQNLRRSWECLKSFLIHQFWIKILYVKLSYIQPLPTGRLASLLILFAALWVYRDNRIQSKLPLTPQEEVWKWLGRTFLWFL